LSGSSGFLLVVADGLLAAHNGLLSVGWWGRSALVQGAGAAPDRLLAQLAVEFGVDRLRFLRVAAVLAVGVGACGHQPLDLGAVLLPAHCGLLPDRGWVGGARPGPESIRRPRGGGAGAGVPPPRDGGQTVRAAAVRG